MAPTVNPTQRRADNKRRSRQHEDWVARFLGGVVVPGSGAFDRPGDVRQSVFLSECKTTKTKTIRVTVEMLEKITTEADTEGLSPLLALRFENTPAGVEQNWFAVPARIFGGLYRQQIPTDRPHATSGPKRRR